MSNPGMHFCIMIEKSRTPQPDDVRYDNDGNEVSRTPRPDIVVKQCDCGRTE